MERLIFGENLESSEIVEHIIEICPQALIRHFEPIINRTNPNNTILQMQTKLKITHLFAVFIPSGREMLTFCRATQNSMRPGAAEGFGRIP